MVEALIVIPLLLAFIAGSHYVYLSGASTLDTLYKMREEAWTNTIDGCGPPSWDVQAILSNRIVMVMGGAAGAAAAVLNPPTGNESWWDSAMQLVVELLHGEDVYVATPPSPPNAPAAGEGSPRAGAPASPSLEVLMGCNEKPHDLGTRRSLIQWARELVFN
jgi:hypothetical protein